MKHIRMSKFESEELPVIISMLNRCTVDGEHIYLASVNCTVQSGEDPNPNAMLSGSATVTNGDIVQQLVIGGLPGVVYELWVAARSTLGNVYIDTVPLAVLADQAPTPPDFTFVLDSNGFNVVTNQGDYVVV